MNSNEPYAQTAPDKGSVDSRGVSTRHICPVCSSQLLIRGLVSVEKIRCGRCGGFSDLGINRAATDPLAWRSFWLGLASLVFLFLTGIPAIYYGVRSLLKTKFRKSRMQDRVAAIVGTALGGVMGLMVGPMTVMMAAFIGLTLLSIDRSDDAQVITEKFQQSCELEMPEDWVGKSHKSLMMGAQQEFVFHSDDSPPSLRINILYERNKISFSKQAMIARLRSRYTPNVEPVSDETLTWTIDGQEIEVRKRVFQVPPKEEQQPEPKQSKSEQKGQEAASRSTVQKSSLTVDEATDDELETVKHFYGVLTDDSGYYGFVIYVNDTLKPRSDKSIQDVMETFRPLK